MPGRFLTIAAIASLAGLAVLGPGNFAVLGPEVAWPTAVNKPARRSVAVLADNGRFAIWCDSYDSDYPALPKANAARVDWIAQPGWPSLERSLWQFDLHRLRRVPLPGLHAFLFACPLWCLELPCLAAPLLWWKRRKRPDQQGFVVILPQTARLQ